MHKKELQTLGLVITDGVGYRNFILSNFLEEALRKFGRLVIYSGLPHEVFKVSSYSNVEVRMLPVFMEAPKTWFWRKSKELAHLQLHKNFFGINDNLLVNRAQTGSVRGKATKLIFAGTKIFHSEAAINFLEKLQENSLADNEVTMKCLDYLKKDRPDLLFFTHQRPPYVVPLIVAAKKLSIKTTSFIFSWDNLASKGRMAANFGSYLVWSELMKEELLYFYPGTNPEAVRVIGTPQFEPYVLEKYEPEESQFFESFDLDEKKKTICYSCGDASTSKNDELYIEVIGRALEEGKITGNPNFLIRTSPAEDPERFFSLSKKYPQIKWNYPDWVVSREDHPEPWSQRLPLTKDLTDLRAILTYCDLSINMCSTMSLDFMIFDKPVINPVFGNEENGLYNDQRFLKFGHYEKVVQSGAVRIAKNEEELIKNINIYLEHPGRERKERRSLLDLQISYPLEDTSKRIATALQEILKI